MKQSALNATKITVASNKLKKICNEKIIYSYRIEKAMEVNMLKDINLHNEITIYKRIIYAVDIHRKAMELVLIH